MQTLNSTGARLRLTAMRSPPSTKTLITAAHALQVSNAAPVFVKMESAEAWRSEQTATVIKTARPVSSARNRTPGHGHILVPSFVPLIRSALRMPSAKPAPTAGTPVLTKSLRAPCSAYPTILRVRSSPSDGRVLVIGPLATNPPSRTSSTTASTVSMA